MHSQGMCHSALFSDLRGQSGNQVALLLLTENRVGPVPETVCHSLKPFLKVLYLNLRQFHKAGK